LAGAIKFVAGAEQARGEVISVESRRDSEGDVTYKPTIRYQRSDGRVFEAETYMSSSGYDFDRGHQVDILYSYVDPYEVRINTFFSLYGLGLIFGSFGAGFLGILLWQRRKRAGRTTVEEMVEVVADAVAERVQDEASEERGTRTTDPSKPGHAHEPKPKHTPTIRRMR